MGETLSQQLRGRILTAILEGRYRPGEPLPSIRALGRMFKVSTRTVQKAIRALREEGVVEARGRKGVFVKSVGLVADRSRQIAVASPYGPAALREGGGYPGSVVAALDARLRAADYSLVLCPLRRMNELEVVEHLQGLGLAGIALLEVDNDRLVMDIRDLRLPMVSMDYDTYRLGVCSVVFDNVWAGFLAAELLIDRGHRAIVALHAQHTRQVGGNPFIDAVEEDRMAGYRIAMKHAGLPVRVERFPAGPAALHRRMTQLFKAPARPTALVCKNEFDALSAIAELRAMELAVPRHVSVLCFGGAPAAFGPGKRIGAIRVDCAGMGRTAARFLLEEIAGRTQQPQRRVLPVKAVLGHSVAGPPQR
jgi:DNA-binding LacI/PurR family transcriptional regulator